jgi:hypothetical protein
MKFVGFLFVLFVLFFSFKIFAFPENVRHGYFSCTACHVSPSGGGVLTPYGRSLSAELMSTWGTTKNAGFLLSDSENEKFNPSWLRDNIFLRGVQTRRNSPRLDKAQFIPMQADVEAGVDTDKFAIIASAGFRSPDQSQSNDLTQFFSRRHYALYRFNDNWSARAGKFIFSFGLNGPDHVTATRRGLGWDEGSESYNLEASFLTETKSTVISFVGDAPNERSVVKDKGLAINQSFLIGKDSKVGVSAFAGTKATYDREILGPYWIWSFSKKVFLDSEIFYQLKKISTTQSSQSGYATFHRLGYEFEKGITVFAQFDRSFLNTADETTQYDSYGPGLQWLPFPHFELMGYLGKEKAFGQDATDFWWLMFNIYL